MDSTVICCNSFRKIEFFTYKNKYRSPLFTQTVSYYLSIFEKYCRIYCIFKCRKILFSPYCKIKKNRHLLRKWNPSSSTKFSGKSESVFIYKNICLFPRNNTRDLLNSFGYRERFVTVPWTFRSWWFLTF